MQLNPASKFGGLQGNSSRVDGCLREEEDIQRLILDDLLYFFPGPYVMLTAFLDESGTHEGSPVMCVGGFLFNKEQILLLDQEWLETLKWAGINCFHAREYHQRITLIGDEKEDQLYRKLIALVRKYARGGAIAFGGDERQFDQCRTALSWGYSQYVTCAYACIQVLLETARKVDDGKVDFMIESGHKNMG